MPKTKFTQETWDEAIKMYQDGYGVSMVAKAFDMSPMTLYNHLKKRDLLDLSRGTNYTGKNRFEYILTSDKDEFRTNSLRDMARLLIEEGIPQSTDVRSIAATLSWSLRNGSTYYGFSIMKVPARLPEKKETI